MKKSFIVSIMLLAASALADDMTAMRHLEPKQTKKVSFEVPKGQSSIQVTSDTPGAFFDCSLNNEEGHSYNKVNTNVCDFLMEFDAPHVVELHITNGTGKPIDCKAAFHNKAK